MTVAELFAALAVHLVVTISALWALFKLVVRPTIDSWIDARVAPMMKRVETIEDWRRGVDQILAKFDGTFQTRMDYADKAREEQTQEIISLRKSLNDLRGWLMGHPDRRGS